MARNVLGKSDDELVALRAAGLSRLYIGPESGDDATLRRIAKGDDAAAHVEAAQRAHAAGMELSVIALLGIGGERSEEHARATGELVTAMDPAVLLRADGDDRAGHAAGQAGRHAASSRCPTIPALLGELRTMVDHARPRDAVFRTNHASNYLPLGGRLPADRERIVAMIDAALAGRIPLRPEWMRGL